MENKFKVGDKVRIKRTGKIEKINEINGDDFDKDLGYSNQCYIIGNWDCYTVHDLELVEDDKIRELEIEKEQNGTRYLLHTDIGTVNILRNIDKTVISKLNEVIRKINEWEEK